MAMLLPVLFCFLHLASAKLPWWQTSILYQIYPRSFADSDGDGNGDIKGITNHIPYLKDLGVGIVWLSPIFESPMKDMGYDVSDYRKVNPLFGTMADVEELIEVVHNHSMKLFLDFVPNHSSDQHQWFNDSRHRLNDKDDYYVWRNPSIYDTTPQPPNNWRSLFGGSAWTYDEVRQQFYLHQFGSYQPDLNYRNKLVIVEMQDNMKFWFKKGIDGFRVDAVPNLVEDDQFRDEPEVPNCNNADSADCLEHIYTQNLPGTYDVMKLNDEMLEQYDTTPNQKYLFLEVYATYDQTFKYYQKHSSPFNFNLITKLTKDTNATELKGIIDDYMSHIDNSTWPNWVIGNHDNPRVGSRMGPEMIDAMNMMVLMLPGASITFQGEEIGMVDTYIRKDEILDSTGRDPERTPMQWDQTKNAGFSRGSRTWLPVNPNYREINVKNETGLKSSHLYKYKSLAAERKGFVESKEFQTATFGKWVFGLKRTSNNKEYYVIINLNNVEEEVILKEGFEKIQSSLYVQTPSVNSRFKIGDRVKTNSKIILQPRSALGLSSASSVGVKISLVVLISALWCFIFGKSNCSIF